MSNVSSNTLPPESSPTPGTGRAGWGPATGVGFAVAAFFGAQIVAAVLVTALSRLAAQRHALAASWLDSVPGQFIFTLISSLVTLLALRWFLRRRHTDLGSLGLNAFRPRYISFAALGVLVYFGLYVLVVALVSSLVQLDFNQKQEIGFNSVTGHLQLVLTFVSLVLLPPFIEEITFRGFVFGGLRSRLGFMWSTLITSVLFALPHLLESSNGLLWVVGLDTFILSIVLCFLREKTGSLWPSILVHMCKNGVAFVSLFILVAR